MCMYLYTPYIHVCVYERLLLQMTLLPEGASSASLIRLRLFVSTDVAPLCQIQLNSTRPNMTKHQSKMRSNLLQNITVRLNTIQHNTTPQDTLCPNTLESCHCVHVDDLWLDTQIVEPHMLQYLCTNSEISLFHTLLLIYIHTHTRMYMYTRRHFGSSLSSSSLLLSVASLRSLRRICDSPWWHSRSRFWLRF